MRTRASTRTRAMTPLPPSLLARPNNSLNKLNVPGKALNQQYIGTVITAVMQHLHGKSPTFSPSVAKELRTGLSSLFAANGKYFGSPNLGENKCITAFVTGARKIQVEKGYGVARQADTLDIEQFTAALIKAFSVILEV